MVQSPKKVGHLKPLGDRIEGDRIFLDSRGHFPKELIILLGPEKVLREYRIVKTRNGRFILN
jgi:hypothetical protein